MPKGKKQLSYKKCDRCRKDRQKCLPENRLWPGRRCDRCLKYGYICSASKTKPQELTKPSRTGSVDPQDPGCSVGLSPQQEGRRQRSEIQCLQDLGDIRQLIVCYLDSDQDCKDNSGTVCFETLRKVLQDVVQEAEAWAQQYEADGRYKDAAYLYARINSDLKQNSQLVPTRAAVYEKMGDFPAAEIAQEKLMGILFDDGSEGPDEEQMREAKTLSRLFNLFHARVRLVGSASQTYAKLSIVYRAAILDLEELNTALFEQGLIVIDRCDQWSCSSLHIAAKKKAPNLAWFLLQKGADINLVDGSGETPLHVAVKQEADEIALILLNHGADTEIRDKSGQTALHAALSGWINEEILSLLIENNADIEARDSSGRTPLHDAITRNLQTTAQSLIRHGADVNASCDLVDGSRGMLCDAVTLGQDSAVKMLLDAGADLQKGNTGRLALYNALADGQDSIAKLLLDHGAQLHNATTSLGSSTWSALLDRAIDKPSGEMVGMILKAGGDLDVQDSFGDTALHRLMRNGQQPLERKVSLLLDLGAQVSVGNSVADTPLHLAVHHGRPKIVQMLLDAGAEAQFMNMLGETPLGMARDRSIDSSNLQEKETWTTLARHMQHLLEQTALRT